MLYACYPPRAKKAGKIFQWPVLFCSCLKEGKSFYALFVKPDYTCHVSSYISGGTRFTERNATWPWTHWFISGRRQAGCSSTWESIVMLCIHGPALILTNCSRTRSVLTPSVLVSFPSKLELQLVLCIQRIADYLALLQKGPKGTCLRRHHLLFSTTDSCRKLFPCMYSWP